jgi:predicted phage baseplate assembly protein
MTLPAPNLDDRRFQELVDEAKRMVQSKWPEWTGWTDHNVSDPGVTLIETFAYMVDQLLYRLNRVPDRTYVKLLDLMGLRLHPPTGAVTPVTFWLSAPQATTTVIPAETEVATERTETTEAVVFHTMEPLDIVSSHLVAVVSVPEGGASTDLTDPLAAGREVMLFSPRPAHGDAVYLGLSAAVPSCVVAVRLFGQVEGYGINPDRPPRRWQAWCDSAWVDCDIERDETGGFNRSGVIVLHVPPGHETSVIGNRSCGWLRCVITQPEAGEHSYDASPRVERVEAFTVGGTVAAIHSVTVPWETMGVAEGSAGQEFVLNHRPVVLSPDPEIVDEIFPAADADELGIVRTRQWTRVDSFAGHGPDDFVFTMDPVMGAVQFPPAVRRADGTVQSYGAVPAAGNEMRLRAYRSGGGRAGNVAARSIRHLRSSIPGINAVQNRTAASGGVDGELVDEAKLRGPLMLRTRDRAVTAGDFEHLTREAAPDVARVVCPDLSGSDPGTVRVLIVPAIPTDPTAVDPLRFEQLRPSAETLERIAEYLDERRVVGVRVVVETPQYRGITVVARLRVRRDSNPVEVRAVALNALHRYYHPAVGGPDGRGWPFGRPVHAGEVHAVLQGLPGVDYVDEALLFAYDVHTGRRDEAVRERIDLPPTGLVFSFGHDVIAEATR